MCKKCQLLCKKMKKSFFWHKNVNFCVKKRKKSFFWHKNVFFWYKNGFFTKKMSFNTKMSQKRKKSIFDSNFGFFHSFWGSTPKMGQKWPMDPPFGGSAKFDYQIQWGAEKDYQIQWGARNHFFGGSKKRPFLIIKFNGFFGL